MAHRIVEATKGRHTATIVFSHGLGDSADGWYPLAVMLQRKYDWIKWILPTAESQKVTLNGGMKMNSWFDIFTLSPSADGSTPEDEAGMKKSVDRINDYVTREIESGIPAERIVVGGFSQGAVIALLTGVTSDRKLAGVISFSGFLGMGSKVSQLLSDQAKTMPILWGHGTSDQVVRYSWGETSVKKLKEMGVENIDFKTYKGMGHSMCDQEQADLQAWIEKILPREVAKE